MNRATRASLLVLASLLLTGGCAGGSSDDRQAGTLTQRQRDSVLAETPLPGARAVGKAISFSDSTAARARRLDSLAK